MYITREQLAEKISCLPADIDRLRRNRQIPCLQISNKLIRYDLSAVLAALARYSKKEMRVL